MLQVRLFGPFQIASDGQPLPRLASKKSRWLVALLALHPGESVSREWLAQTLWPDQYLVKARAYLRQALTDLRNALGPHAHCIESPDPQHLRLSAEARVDLHEFDIALVQDPLRAIELYEARLLEDCDEEWAVEARRHREAGLIDALTGLAENAPPNLAAGHFAKIVQLDPFRESAQRGLIRANFESGNDAAAVLAYRAFKLLLHRELHAEPSAETTLLYRDLRVRIREREALRDSPAAQQPTRGKSRRWLIVAACIACGISLLGLLRQEKPRDLLHGPLRDLCIAARLEAYGPNEEALGKAVLARWPEIQAEADRLKSDPAALADFASPLWRSAYTLSRGNEVGEWLRQALTSKALPPATEAFAAANLAFQLNIDSRATFGRDLVFARRSHSAAIKSGDPWLIAHCLRSRGFAERTTRDRHLLEQGRLHYDQAYAAFRELRDLRGIALMETCYATGGAAGEDYLTPDYYACALWSAKAYHSWVAVGNAWGENFSAAQLRERLVSMNDITRDRKLCVDAESIFERQAARVMAVGSWQESKSYRCWQAILLIQLGETGKAVKCLKSLYEGEQNLVESEWGLVMAYEAEPTNIRLRTRLLEDLRQLADEMTILPPPPTITPWTR
ncbi:MAG TPA: BTAD domain-containing putative transcriptional regulator [Fimbriimonas sp.]|nr:BTAD domain-containing putative transcriptional regulator [Fimbriimonas sp.]